MVCSGKSLIPSCNTVRLIWMQECVNACERQMFVHVIVRSGYCTYKRASLYWIVRAIQNAGTHVIVQVLVISSTCALTNACVPFLPLTSGGTHQYIILLTPVVLWFLAPELVVGELRNYTWQIWRLNRINTKNRSESGNIIYYQPQYEVLKIQPTEF
jgi:hypothetical protein